MSKKRDKSVDKKKKQIILILLLIFVFLVIGFIVYLNMMSMSTTINFRNKKEANTNISNVKITYEDGRVINPISESSYIKEDNDGVYKVIHRAGYGLYTYTFDVDIDGKIITPEINIFKTNQQDKYDVEIGFVVVPEGSIYTACITVSVNGSSMYQQIEDIENKPISIQYGP